MSGPVLHVTGARPNFPRPRRCSARSLDARCAAAAAAHRPALRRADVGGVLPPARPARAGHQPGRRLGQHARQTAAIMAGARGRARPSCARRWSWSTATSTPPSPPPWSRRSCGSRCPRRGRPAQLRPDDARGDQPPGHRPAVRPALRDQRGRASAHLGNEGVAPDADPLRRQPDDRHAAGQPGPLRRGAAARPSTASTGRYVVATLHRPANVDRPTDAAELVEGACTRSPTRPSGAAAAPARPGQPARPPASSTTRGSGSSTRSATSSSSAWSAAPRPWSPTPAASRRRPPSSACRA